MKELYCPNCGAQLDDAQIFCSVCNNNVRYVPRASMGAAYAKMWKKAFDFKGRARRSEYWLAVLANGIISLVLMLLSSVASVLSIVSLIYAIAAIVPGLSLLVRRLHDTGRSGHWLWLSFTGYGIIAIFIFCCQDKKQPINRFGNSEKWYSVYNLSGGEENDAV